MFQTGSTFVWKQEYFRFKQGVLRLETGVLPFQTGSTPVWKQEYYRFKQVGLPFENGSTIVSNGSTLDRDKNGTECLNQLEWVGFFFWLIPEEKCIMF